MGFFRTLLVKYALLSKVYDIFLTKEQNMELPNSSSNISSSHGTLSSNSLEHDDGGEQIPQNLAPSLIPSLTSQHFESEEELASITELSTTLLHIPETFSTPPTKEVDVEPSSEHPISSPPSLPISMNHSLDEVDAETSAELFISSPQSLIIPCDPSESGVIMTSNTEHVIIPPAYLPSSSNSSAIEGGLVPMTEPTPLIPSTASNPSASEGGLEFMTEPIPLIPSTAYNPSACEGEIEPTIKRKISPIIFKGSQLSKHKNSLQSHNVKGKTIFTCSPKKYNTNRYYEGNEKTTIYTGTLIVEWAHVKRKRRIVKLIRSLQSFFSHFEAGPYPLFFEKNERLQFFLKEFVELEIPIKFIDFLKQRAQISEGQIVRFLYNSVLFDMKPPLHMLYKKYPKQMSDFYERIELSKMTPMLFYDVMRLYYYSNGVKARMPLVKKLFKLCIQYLKVFLKKSLTWDMIYNVPDDKIIAVRDDLSMPVEGYDLLQHNLFFYMGLRNSKAFETVSFDILMSYVKRGIQPWEFGIVKEKVQCTSSVISRLFNNTAILPLQRIAILNAMSDRLDPKIPRSCYFDSSTEDQQEISTFIEEEASRDSNLRPFIEHWSHFYKNLAPDSAMSYGYARRALEKDYRTTLHGMVKNNPDQCPLEEIKDNIKKHAQDPEKLRENFCPLLFKCPDLSHKETFLDAAVKSCSLEHFHANSFSTIISNLSINNSRDNEAMFTKMIEFCTGLMEKGVEIGQCELLKSPTNIDEKDYNFFNNKKGMEFAKRYSLVQMESMGFSLLSLLKSPILLYGSKGVDAWLIELINNPRLFSLLTARKMPAVEREYYIFSFADWLAKTRIEDGFAAHYLALLTRIRSYTEKQEKHCIYSDITKEQILNYELCVFLTVRNDRPLRSWDYIDAMKTIDAREKHLPGYEDYFNTLTI